MDSIRTMACALMLAALSGALGACCAAPKGSDPVAAVPGKVTDVRQFDAFVDTRPTPAQFRQRYPDVVLVLPGEIATKEMRLDRSRYFAELDGDGRIRGGRFQ